MDRRRAAAALFALAACVACSSAAPTVSNPTALDLHEGPTEGCYYNFQHYGEGDRIMTNEPCLNCTCHNRMLMCYLRVCPFTKAIGQDCTVEKRADQCCPIVTCPDVPVDLLTSTSTLSPAEYGPTGVGKLDKYGCSINNKYFPEGSKVPSSPNKPCEHCYCIRNMTTCVMQECTLHVDGCTPIYHKDVCCPVRYSCDHSEDEIPLLDDMTTTVRPTQGFLLTTTTMMPVTQMTQDCTHDEQIFLDGASIKTDKACEHCYCMKGDIVCVVQECGTPMENEGKNCTSLPPRQGQCCPDTYICEGDEPSLDLTPETMTELTSMPPRRVGVEGSGYRNEPDEPFTERHPFEHDIEGSGDTSETDMPTKVSPEISDEILLGTTEKETLYSQNTEANKEFETVTDKILEKESSVTSEEDSLTPSTESILLTSSEPKATIADEIIPSDGVTPKHEDDITKTEAPLHSYESDVTLPTDISKPKETSFTLHEQTTAMDEQSGYSATETTSTPIKTETEVMSNSKDVTTTEHSTSSSIIEKDHSNDDIYETTEITSGDATVTEQNKPDIDYSTEKEFNIVKDMTTVNSNKDVAETTSINPVDNEVDYIPGRIPGEGDCLLNGVTYGNNTSVPNSNNCHTGCKCISSIIKCDPIICSPPPEYMENMNDCQPSYDSPDACCPTYVCSAKETVLPQSHSQTSVTESSKPVPAEQCNGNDCIYSEVKQPASEPDKLCDSGNCDSGSTKEKDCGSNGCQGETQTPLEQPVQCSGDKCSISPTVTCDGENCETSPTDIDDKSDSVSPNKPICNDDDGCDNIKDISPTPSECKDGACKRKEISETGTSIAVECSRTECKIDNEQKIPLHESTISPVTEYIFNDKYTETASDELDDQKIASPVPQIVTPEKATTTESTTYIDSDPTKVEVHSTDKILTDIITTEEPTKLSTESDITKLHDTVTEIVNVDKIVTEVADNPQEKITESETYPTELIPILDNATEKSKTPDKPSTEQEFYTKAPGLEETEAFTESKLVDYTSENKDTTSQEHTKEISQTTTLKSETLLDSYETKPDESYTKLPIVMDTEKEIQSMEIPSSSEKEVKVTADSDDYPMTTEKIGVISVTGEKEGITLQPTKIEETVKTELPESAIEIGGGNKDHAESIPTETQDLTTELIQGEAEYDNKFTTVKSITIPETIENGTPIKPETQSIILETDSSESTTPIQIISTGIRKTYTELPQTIGTLSDIGVDFGSGTTDKLDESDNKIAETTTPNSDVKQPEEFSTKVDEIMSEDGHPQTEYQEHATTERNPTIFNYEEPNVDLNLSVTEKQTTISQMKDTEEEQMNEVEEEILTKLPKVDKVTERTELEMTTETYKDTDIKDFKDRDSQTESSFDNDFDKDITVTESAHLYTSNEGPQPTTELTSKDQHLDLQTSTIPQDIFATKDTSTAAILRDEGDIEITSSTEKNVIKITEPSSDESVTEDKYIPDVVGGEELTTQLPKEMIEHHPTKDVDNTEIPIESTTNLVISEEKQQSPDLDLIDKDITTALPVFTKEVNDEFSSRIPELIPQREETTDIPSQQEMTTLISVHKTKEEEKTENDIEENSYTTISNIQISESVTDKNDMQPQKYPTQESIAEKSTEKSDVIETDLITESPYLQTESIDLDKYATIASDEYEVEQKPKLPASETNDDNKPMSTSVPLLNQDDEITTEKITFPDTLEKESTTEKSEYDVSPDKDVQPSVSMSTESNTDHEVLQDNVTENKEIEIVESSTSVSYVSTPQIKSTEIAPTAYETEIQNTESSSSIQEDEKTSSEVPKQTTEEYQTSASVPIDQSYTSSSKSDIVEDVTTTEAIPIKQEDLPVKQEMPVENIYTIPDESYTLATKLKIDDTENNLMTTVVPIKHEELPKHPESAFTPTIVPEFDTEKEEKGISKIESAILSYTTTESLITSQPSLITSPEESKTDSTKSTIIEEQPLPFKTPEPIIESTSRTETESVTENENVELTYTTEKQYVSKSDHEEIPHIPKVPEVPEEQNTITTDIETVSKHEDFEAFTTEKQYVNKLNEEDIPKIPAIVDEQSNAQNDIESVTKLDDIEPFTTEKQYVTKTSEEVPENPDLPKEQSTDRSHIEVVSKTEDSVPFTTEIPYITKLEQEVPYTRKQTEDQSTSRYDSESVTQLEDTESFVTEKQYVTNSDQEEVPKTPVQIDEQREPQMGTDNIININDIESYTTEKQDVTKIDEEELPKISEVPEEQNTAKTDIETVSKYEDSGTFTTEKQQVTKLDDEDIPKVPVVVDEQSNPQSDIISVTSVEDTEPFTTEKQYVTKSNEEIPETPELPKEETTDRIDIEIVSKAEETGPLTTEIPYVTKLDNEVSKTPEQIEDQNTSVNDLESVTKLEDEALVTEKQYVTNSDQEDTSKFPIPSEEQSTSRIVTESVTKLEDSEPEISSHKFDDDASKPEKDINENTEKPATEQSSYPDTTVKSELESSDLFKPSEDVPTVTEKEDSTVIIPTDLFVSTAIPEKVETPVETDSEKIDDSEKYSTERNVQTSIPAEESVTLEEVPDVKPYDTEHKTSSEVPIEKEGIYTETTPYSVLLEEHTHPVLEDTSSNIPIEEGTTTMKNEVQPEHGDQIPDMPVVNDEYERTTAKQVQEESTTSYRKTDSPIVQSSDIAATISSVEKITTDTGVQEEDKKYSPSMQDEGLTTPIVLPPNKEKEQEQQTISPVMSDKEITTLRDVIASSEEPGFSPSPSKGDDSTQELYSTSKLPEESTTQFPPTENKYKEKPYTSSPSPSSSEMPDIVEEPHEDEHLPDFPPSGTGAGYGQEPDYVEEDQAFGPGTCRYGGKVYVSAQQIPRDDPCDFCFCFRSDIICLQQSCPPPIHGCHEEPIQGFCCPRYECPVSMATTVNVTTTTTTTTTTLPPHFLPHAYKGHAQRRGCQIKGHSYKVGEVVRASSGPCLHCTCGGDGQMKCDPKVCTPEPMLRQMIAAAVSAKRRR